MNAPAFLIDTDWVIDHLNGIAPISHRLEELREHGLALSAVSVAELWEGVYFSRDPERSQGFLEDFLSGVTTVGIDDEICKRFARLRGSLRRQGKLIGDFDLTDCRFGPGSQHDPAHKQQKALREHSGPPD